MTIVKKILDVFKGGKDGDGHIGDRLAVKGGQYVGGYGGGCRYDRRPHSQNL